MGKSGIARKAGSLACAAVLGGALAFGGVTIAPPAETPQEAAPIGVVQAYASSKVYIAPYSGKKYHRDKHCRGLRRARYVKKISVKNAKRQGYTKCRICYR